MSFTRAHRRISGEGPRRRDRHGIVGLSGWLFADLLLGIAIVFLVIQNPPTDAGKSDPDDRRSPSVVIAVAPNSLERPDSDGGAGYWSDAAGRPLEVGVTFDEPVFAAALSGVNLDELVRLGGDASGLRPWELKSRSGQLGASKEFVLTIVQAGPIDAGSLTIQLDDGFARDNNGNPSKKSNLLSVEVRTGAVSIDPELPIQFKIPRPTASNCARTTEQIRNVESFSIRRVGLNPGETKNENLVTWVQGAFPEVRFGFSIITGGGGEAEARQRAFNSTPCVESALRELGWLDEGRPLVARYYGERRLDANEIKIDIYFLTSSAIASNVP